MAFLGGWLGKYLGNWIGATAAPTVTVTVSVSIVSITAISTVVTTGVKAVAIPSTVVIIANDATIYDYNDAYIQTGAGDMRISIPEIIASSTDITNDMRLAEGIAQDLNYLDGTQAVKLVRKTDNVTIDLIKGEAIPENKIYTYNHALIRQVSDRDNKIVKQLRLFMQSVQNDEINTIDTIIELPNRSDVIVKSADQIHTTNEIYTIVAVDICTLKTRIRIGARRIT